MSLGTTEKGGDKVERKLRQVSMGLNVTLTPKQEEGDTKGSRLRKTNVKKSGTPSARTTVA